jgi:heavy metal sensor kinase
LQLWLAFLLICILSGFGFAVYQLQHVNQLKRIDDELERHLAAVSGAVRGRPPGFGPGLQRFERTQIRSEFEKPDQRPPPPWGWPDGPPPDGPGGPGMRREIRIPAAVASLFDETEPAGFYFTVWSREGSSLKRSTNAPDDTPIPTRLRGDTRTHTRERDRFREAYHFTELGECVLVGRDIAADRSAERKFALLLLAAGGALLTLGLGVGWWLTTRAIRPIETIGAAARRISAGNLSERITPDDPDNELGRLADVLNSTFSRLEAAFNQQKQFTADASHELRTPLAVIISEAQTALARDRSAAEYRETVEACLDSAQQMRRLTESLLDLARLDAGSREIAKETVDLAEVARAIVDRTRVLAERRGIVITCDLASAITTGSAELLGQVATNLLTNAVHYNRSNGTVHITTRREDSAAILKVADTGIGISAEDLPRVFERFYRADKSRTNAGGRSGLGLAICKAIVDLHGGTIDISSQPGTGTTVTLRLLLHTG